MCPFQVNGTFNGQELYFRYRWGSWKLSLDGVAVRQSDMPDLLDNCDEEKFIQIFLGWYIWGQKKSLKRKT